MEKKVSTTNTKTEIIEAYNELLKQVETQKSANPKDLKEKEDRETIVKTASLTNKDGIIKQIAELKIALNAELEKVEESLISESKKLIQVQEAISIQEKRLDEVYGINATADSVSVMLAMQKEKKEAFEKEMAEAKQKWEKEQKDSELQAKEDKERLAKQRKREEEEYTYNLAITRKKDNDQYELKKQLLDKELTDKKNVFEQEIKSREQAVIAAETELKELRDKTAGFQKQIDQAVKQAVAESTDKIQTTNNFENQLKAKEFESEVKLRDQEIANLKAKIKDIDSQLSLYISKAEQSDKSAKDIAIRAIESSANYKIIERAKEAKEDSGK